MVARDHRNDIAATARHFRWPAAKVQAAVNYAAAFPAEVESAIAENDAVDLDSLRRMLPQSQEFVAGAHSRKR